MTVPVLRDRMAGRIVNNGVTEETVDMDQIKRRDYLAHGSINPTGIVPKGPDTDFTLPHGRG